VKGSDRRDPREVGGPEPKLGDPGIKRPRVISRVNVVPDKNVADAKAVQHLWLIESCRCPKKRGKARPVTGAGFRLAH
jgi:hypothetical protein